MIRNTARAAAAALSLSMLPVTASAISVGDSVMSGGYTFTVIHCAASGSGAGLCNDNTGRINFAASADGVGFDLDFSEDGYQSESAPAAAGENTNAPGDITLRWSVTASREKLAAISGVWVGLTADVNDGGFERGVGSANVAEALFVSSSAIGAYSGFETQNYVVKGVSVRTSGVDSEGNVEDFENRVLVDYALEEAELDNIGARPLIIEKDIQISAFNGGYAGVDRVTQRLEVGEVPLPAPFALLAAALGLLGYAGRRRSAV